MCDLHGWSSWVIFSMIFSSCVIFMGDLHAWSLSVYGLYPHSMFSFSHTCSVHKKKISLSWVELYMSLNILNPNSIFFVAWSILLFSSMVDVVIALENDGYLGRYLHFYLLQGEPYLKTPHGTSICYWDGSVHFALYMFIMSRSSYK